MTMKITAALLRAKYACEIQVRQFEALFPNGVEITSDLCVLHADSFDWGWAAKNLLPPDKYADYKAKTVPRYADYEVKVAALFADYRVKVAQIYADCKTKFAFLWADHKVDALWAGCKAEITPLWADYKAKAAGLFASLAE